MSNLLWPILRNCIRHRSATAVIDDRRTMTYRELLGGAMFVADAIDSRTDRPHVGIMLPTSGAFPVSELACWLARKVAVPLNYLLAEDELNYVIHDSEIDIILTARVMIEHLGGPERFPDSVTLVYLDDLDFTGFPPLRWPPIPRGDDLAALLYTSGTSGRPKGVMLTHTNLHSNAAAGITKAGIKSADHFLGVLPQFHSFGLTGLTHIPLLMGAPVIYTARFMPRKIVSLLREHRPEVFMAIPSMYAALAQAKDASADDFKSVRILVSGGEPLPESVYKAFLERFGVEILEGYGLTETSPVTHWSSPKLKKHGAVGTPVPGVTVLIVDEDLKPVPTGTDGEVLVAGPNVMKGYFKLEKETQACFVTLPDPTTGKITRFFRTGDIGREDEQQFLTITGRLKEMMIVGGENVFPREIEEVLTAHPSVHAAAVVGRRDVLRGEMPIAFIELTEGATFDEPALRTHCRQHLAGYKVPREIHLTPELPRSPTGKILRRKLNVDPPDPSEGSPDVEKA